ncbi:MAG: glycosyltransferase [Lachnospiraceae bacterium]|nr:glycosyltransferase [Lachnospiraceae bacterium]MBO4903644.1 glycosyltransferase [Lachnospiraceae bacterium]
MGYKLSVIFITYNHGAYVEKALRSVLAQETDFPFEVVVGEDCSDDGTQEILKRIAKEYPEHEATGPGDRQIRLFLRQKNTGGRPTLNVYETTKRCTGEYLAYLEGDDYWTDPHKLQKQVDILESHSEYIAVTHDIEMVDEHDDPITDKEILKIGDLYDWRGVFTYRDYCYSGKWPGHYATVVSRNIYKDEKYDYTILYRASDFTDDALINLFLLMQGDIYRTNEKMSAWRYVKKTGGSNWNSIAIKRNIAREDSYLSKTMMQWIEQYRALSDYSTDLCLKNFGAALKDYIRKPTAANKRYLDDMYDYGITHVVMKDKKTSLFTFSVRYILGRIKDRI